MAGLSSWPARDHERMVAMEIPFGSVNPNDGCGVVARSSSGSDKAHEVALALSQACGDLAHLYQRE